MPYEATVPVHRRLLWPAVTDAERLIGALPNVSIDAAGAQGVAGRLRVRTREQTVTFRGVARIVDVVPASLRVSVEVEAVFGRAGGTVEGVVEIALRQAGSGTRVAVDGQLELNPGAATFSVDALNAAFGRVVQRWFTALAETSPAQSPTSRRAPARTVPVESAPPEQFSPAEPSERTGDTAQQSAGERSSDERTRRRSAERAPLAVVRDLSEEQEGAEADDAAAAEPPQPADPRSQTSSASNGWAKARQEADEEEADVQPQQPQPHAPAPLRLVTPRPQTTEEVADPEVAGPQAEGNSSSVGDPNVPAESEPDDIWSRLRDRSVPPWIPFLIGAATATLAALTVVLTALRRRYRR